MSGGKRNHEDLSDEMALLEAALKVHRGRTVAHSSARIQAERQMVVERSGGLKLRGWSTSRERRERSRALRGAAVSKCVSAEREMAGRNLTQAYSERGGWHDISFTRL